jgi:hypothetical protein
MTDHMSNIKNIAEVLIDEIEKYYPGITKQKFDNCGYPKEKGCAAHERAELGLYIELMKAGIFSLE